MKAKHLDPSTIGKKVTVTQETGLIITATLTSIQASEGEDKIRLIFKELTDHKGQRLPQFLNYDDQVELYDTTRVFAPGGIG